MKPVTAEPQENRGFRPDEAISGAVNEVEIRFVVFVLIFLFKVICTQNLEGFAVRNSATEIHRNQTACDHSTKVRPRTREGAFANYFY